MSFEVSCEVVNLESKGQRRLPVDRPVFIRLSDGRSVTARIISISTAGIGIVFRAPGEIGATLDLRFLLAVNLRLHEISAKARIVHSHLKNNDFYSMFEFIDIDNDDLFLVEKFIEEKSIFFPIAA
jgi:hypothetical protein